MKWETLTPRHFLYCSKRPSHSLVSFSPPLRYSAHGEFGVPRYVGDSTTHFRYTISESRCRTSCERISCFAPELAGRKISYSLTSLHSGASEADIVVAAPIRKLC